MGVRSFINNIVEPGREVERSAPLSVSFNDWAGLISSFNFGGLNYTLPGAAQEDIGGSFTGVARGAYKGNGVVFACIQSRLDLFTEARFMFRRLRSGRPGDLFGTSELRLLSNPWNGGTTGDLLGRMLLYADLAGNAYVVRRGDRLSPLRPDWVSIIGGVRGNVDASMWHPDAEVLGYQYQEGGPGSGIDPSFFLAEEVAHFAPRADPEARFRGMSWLTPIVAEIMADKAMTDHRLKFFENGATPNLAVTLNVDSLAQFQEWTKEFKANHDGISNAYKTMFLAAGADAKVIGADLRQIDFKVTQGGGETRVAAAAGVPPVIVGLSEGLEAATYSNYAQARRRFADMTIRTLWRNVCGSLAQIVSVPADAELWYDSRDISALQEDQKDAAEIMQMDATAVKTHIDAGWTPESAMAAVAAKDLTLLTHSGLISVQLQPPGTKAPDAASTAVVPAANGKVPALN